MPNSLVLSPTDRDMISELQKCGVLEPLNGHRLKLDQGVILVPCGDADQMPHIFEENTQCFHDHGIDPRIHLCALSGGALNIGAPPVPRFPDIIRLTGDVLVHHIQSGRRKDIHTVAIYTHAPCLIARDLELSFREQIELLQRAKFRIKNGKNDVSVSCFMQCDFGNGEKTIFFVSKEKWMTYCDLNNYHPSWAMPVGNDSSDLVFGRNPKG